MPDSPFDRLADTPAFADAARVVRTLTSAGHVAYLAGGCVRDALLGLTPKDYDVATDARPDLVRGLFKRSQGVGQAFGVVLVRMPASQIEIATFRADGEYTDGRRPDAVTFAGEVEDARRRDFTINGMFFDPLAGRVIDYVGGQADLAAHTLRAIGDPNERFAEDYLRILRAVRFAARFDLAIEPMTRAAIVANASKLARVAPERVADELRRMLEAPTAVRAVELLDACDVLPTLLRRADAATAIEPPGPPGDSARLLRSIEPPHTFGPALAAIVCDRLLRAGRPLPTIAATATIKKLDAALRETLRYSNDEGDAFRGTLDVGLLLGTGPLPPTATIKRFLARPHAADVLRLLRALDGLDPSAARFAAIEATIAGYPPDQIAPPPLVTGDDLTAMGFAPSRQFKIALDATYDEQLEGRLTAKTDALAFARAKMGAA